jgi:hypothetical protein
MLMRTTLDIEDDVLLAAKELARRGGTTAGRVISHLLRQALTQSPPSTTSSTSVPVPSTVSARSRHGGKW